jgi:hypothetical protein
MRLRFLVIVLLGGLIVGYSSFRGKAADAQVLQTAAITIGETVKLASDAGAGSVDCIAIDIRGDFIGCKADTANTPPGRTAYEHWYKIRLIARIDKPVRPQ